MPVVVQNRVKTVNNCLSYWPMVYAIGRNTICSQAVLPGFKRAVWPPSDCCIIPVMRGIINPRYDNLQLFSTRHAWIIWQADRIITAVMTDQVIWINTLLRPLHAKWIKKTALPIVLRGPFVWCCNAFWPRGYSVNIEKTGYAVRWSRYRECSGIIRHDRIFHLTPCVSGLHVQSAWSARNI